MVKVIKPHSPTQIRNLKPQTQPYPFFDDEGMYIEVLKTGTKNWRMKCKKPDKKESHLNSATTIMKPSDNYPQAMLELAESDK